MARIELKKCPFCGSEVDTVSVKEKDGNLNIEVKSKDRWIPCSERLPEEETSVIAVIDGCSREAFYSCGSFIGSNFYRDAESVTNWMPLPEPPKEDENE